jgi:hypothetical protein
VERSLWARYSIGMSSQPKERRKHSRSGVSLAALVVSGDGTERIATTIVDVSTGGARLRIDAHELAEQFYMLMPEHRLQPCRLVWREGHYAGVQYTS